MRPFRIYALTAVFGLCALVGAAAAGEANAALSIPASDPRFVFEGRIDAHDAAGPVIIWEGTRIRLAFDGGTLGLRFADVKGQVFFNAMIDGHTSLVALREHAPAEGLDFSKLGPGRHELVLFKRSEATAGTARFQGVELAPGAKAFAAKTPKYTQRILFIGDSITVGACNEDGPEDQWEDRRTHNAALSYAQLAAEALGADGRNISVSGMGVAIGWFDKLAGEIWNRVYPDPSAPKADLTRWTPDVVLVNLGENDDSYPRAHKQPFPAKYTGNYVALVQAVRHAYPKARIGLLRGGMFGGANSVELREGWEAAVKRLEADDPKVSHFVFKHWSNTHPRVADDQAMAAELVDWLKARG